MFTHRVNVEIKMSGLPPKGKMCKSPKAPSPYVTSKPPPAATTEQKLIEYESLSTNCTTVGSNNLHLVKKPQQQQPPPQPAPPQQQQVMGVSPAYSNPSPGAYPPSPYSSPAGLKSPSPQGMKPPTPQPATFPVMQIIHNINNHNQLLARPIQAAQQQNIIKLKPHLNILPKPSASPQASPKPSVSPQIVIPTNQPTTTIVPAAQSLLLNQMPVLTTPGVQFILRPQTKIPAQVQAAAPQGLILQQSQPVLQIQPPRSQPLVRVLANGMQLGAPGTTAFVTQVSNGGGAGTPPATNSCQAASAAAVAQHQHVAIGNSLGHVHGVVSSKKKVGGGGGATGGNNKKKKQKLDLANIMKLSGIGDEDDIQFESDTSLSESDHNSIHSQPNTPQPQTVVQSPQNMVHEAKKVGNIQLTPVQPSLSTTTTPLVQVLNQSFPSNVIPTSNHTTTTQSIPFNPFITPNFTINNGLMLQRSTGGFKFTLGEDGRLILQHDPTLNQDLQSQLLLQSLFGLNQLVLQPSIDQVHSQTVQTIQQQSVQTIQQQTVQSQTIQTVQQQTVQPQSVQHSLQTIQQTIQPQIQAVQPQTVQQTVQQTIQHQTVSQPLHNHQPMQIVQPQPIQNINQSLQNIQSQTVHSIQNQLPSNLHSIQNQIQSQIQSILQSQLHQNPTVQSGLNQNLVAQSNNGQGPQGLHQIQTVQSQNQAAVQNLQSIQNHGNQSVNQPLQPSTLQSQGIQTSMHQPVSQQIQTQPILKVQPFQKTQPPVQTVHPQPIPSAIQNQPSPNEQQNTPPHQQPTSYVVNLTPDQLEQLKRCGQVTVNGQTIFMQRSASKAAMQQEAANNQMAGVNDNAKAQVKLSPKGKPVKKVQSKVVTGKSPSVEIKGDKANHVKEIKAMPVVKNVAVQNHTVQVQPQQHVQANLQKQQTNQPSALVQPSVQSQSLPSNQITHQKAAVAAATQSTKIPVNNPALVQPVSSNNNPSTDNAQDVEHLLGQIIEESGGGTAANPPVSSSSSSPASSTSSSSQTITIPVPQSGSQGQAAARQRPQRVHTIQLTPQKQQHLKSIQLQIQTLSARLTPGDTEMHNALNLLFQEQQKILATGKLLPPDKVYYHNNQLTIVNPQPLPSQKVESQHHPGQSVVSVRTTSANENVSSQQVVTQQNVLNNNSSKLSNSPVTGAPIPKGNNVISQHHHHQQQHHHSAQHSAVQAKVPYQNGVTSVVAAATERNEAQLSLERRRKAAEQLEKQLASDQTSAQKPDIQRAFSGRPDACKRLMDYHCFSQPPICAKDLDTADECFELTAKHYLNKFSRMMDKYQCLRIKESMREVPTSELMMLDRMFVMEEQQSLMKLRQDVQENPPTLSQLVPPAIEVTPPSQDDPQEEYDEWACIQKELSSLQPHGADGKSVVVVGENLKRNRERNETDSRLESLKKFRVERRKNEVRGNVSLSPQSLDSNSPGHQNMSPPGYTQQQLVNAQYVVQQQNYVGATQNGSTTHVNVRQQRSIQQFSVQHVSHTVHHHGAAYQQQASNFNNSNSSLSSGGNSTSNTGSSGTDNIIDEQVQSAIDSILNLQQSSLDLDDVNSILS